MKEEIEQVDERIAVLKEVGGLDDEVAQEESYRDSLIENCPNLKVSIYLFALAMKGGEFLHNLMLYLLFYFDTYICRNPLP